MNKGCRGGSAERHDGTYRGAHMGIVGGFERERGGHGNGSACDIINQRELPSAWISGISVSQTAKGLGAADWSVGVGGSVG